MLRDRHHNRAEYTPTGRNYFLLFCKVLAIIIIAMVLGAILSSHKKLQANQTEQFLLETEMGENGWIAPIQNGHQSKYRFYPVKIGREFFQFNTIHRGKNSFFVRILFDLETSNFYSSNEWFWYSREKKWRFKIINTHRNECGSCFSVAAINGVWENSEIMSRMKCVTQVSTARTCWCCINRC